MRTAFWVMLYSEPRTVYGPFLDRQTAEGFARGRGTVSTTTASDVGRTLRGLKVRLP